MNLIWHIIYMSTLVFAMGFALHFYAYKRGLGDEFDEVKTKTLKRDAQGNKRPYKTGNGFLDKWLEFGGGYYGIIAFIQLVFIEIGQVRDFISDWSGLSDFIDSLGIGMLIRILIEQIMNFVAAICWPVDYLEQFSLTEIALFICITFVFYKFSQRVARAKLTQVQAL
ncbi:hypothetical protein [Planctobacterium marinum]|uniref:Uncharacterized protein n=1 Tax=Planctobacterium marinum TaxID=1631968 RepID=A0AA48HS23_9ALTE|nr:hypothetical protein MACH26_03190 [Planctobacterium marinum]